MMIHPATAHFAMVLPVVASALGIAYLINRQEIFSKLSSMALFFTALAMGVVWYTGSQAGPEIYDFLSEAGQHQLVEHKELGLYLAIAMGIIFVLKIIGCQSKKFAIEALAIILLLAATVVTFAQGKAGGEIVYNHGTPFKSYMIIDTLNETTIAVEEEEEVEAKLEVYEEALEDIKLIDEELEIFYGNEAPKLED
ncbi:hypothetical protein JHD46_00185 [Sulfurimonas sp. SAG-AH-194-C20]|nr:DUF2231 domain-containing protein [Sulfurimonas sp. SAG-AH-194-C20]MDF1878049.1 hypothetical protein [Sulfurimonas sp. SAG-AH-194-C20]